MEKKKNSILRLLEFAGKYKFLTIASCILSAISNVLMLIPFVYIWFVVREIINALPGLPSGTVIAHYGWMAVVYSVLGMIIYFIALMCSHYAAFNVACNMRSTALNHIVKLPLGYFSRNSSGKLRKIIDENAAQTESLLAHRLPDFVGAIIQPIVILVLLLVFDWRMGLLSLIPIILSMVFLKQMMGVEKAQFVKKMMDSTEDMNKEAVEYVRGIPVVKTFQQTVYSFKSFYDSIMRYKDFVTEYCKSCQKPNILFTVALNGTFAILLPAGIILLNNTSDYKQTILNLIFYLLFTPACAGMMNKVMYAGEDIMIADEVVKRMDSLLNEKPLVETDNPQKINDTSISFSDVTFTYADSDKPALNNISFTVPEEKTYALVGSSGGGKTTVASMIPRFWDTDFGSVKVGGINVKNIASKELMNHVAFVFQDIHLFKGTILENICAAKPNASREEAINAAKEAQCEDILDKMPNGIDTILGTKGVYLSGGEKQRIALARAILKDAPIIVLDEATAFADPENERQIQLAFEKLINGKTILMIAHRLSTVKDADCILVINNGSIAEKGTHSELLMKQGIYSKMWNDYQTSITWKMKEGVI